MKKIKLIIRALSLALFPPVLVFSKELEFKFDTEETLNEYEKEILGDEPEILNIRSRKGE